MEAYLAQFYAARKRAWYRKAGASVKSGFRRASSTNSDETDAQDAAEALLRIICNSRFVQIASADMAGITLVGGAARGTLYRRLQGLGRATHVYAPAGALPDALAVAEDMVTYVMSFALSLKGAVLDYLLFHA